MITALEILSSSSSSFFFFRKKKKRMGRLFSILAMSQVGSWVPDQGSKLHQPRWKHGALTTGSPGKSPRPIFFRN